MPVGRSLWRSKDIKKELDELTKLIKELEKSNHPDEKLNEESKKKLINHLNQEKKELTLELNKKPELSKDPEERKKRKKQIQALTPEKIKLLPKEQIQALTPEQINWFTKEQIQALTPEQIQEFVARQIWALTNTQIKWLTKEQIQAMTPEQIQVLKPNQIISLTKEQIQAMTPEQIQKFIARQIWSVKVEKIKWFTKEQIQAFSRWQIQTFTSDQIQALTPEQIILFNYIQIRSFTPRQMINFTAPQLEVLTKEQINWLTKEQIQALSPEQIVHFTSEQISLFTKEQLQAITPQAIQVITPHNIIRLRKDQLQALLPQQIQKFIARQIWALDVEKIKWFTKEQIQAFSRWQMQKFTSDQIQAFTTEQIQVFNRIQIRSFAPRNMINFTASQLEVLTKEQIDWLTKEQIQALSPKQKNILFPKKNKESETREKQKEEILESIKKIQEKTTRYDSLKNEQNNKVDIQIKKFIENFKIYLYENTKEITAAFQELKATNLYTNSWKALSHDWNNHEVVWNIRGMLLRTFTKIKNVSEKSIDSLNKHEKLFLENSEFEFFWNYKKNQDKYNNLLDFFTEINNQSIKMLKDTNDIKIFNDTLKNGITIKGILKEIGKWTNNIIWKSKNFHFKDEEPIGQIENLYNKHSSMVEIQFTNCRKHLKIVNSLLESSNNEEENIYKNIFTNESRKFYKNENDLIIKKLEEFKEIINNTINKNILENKVSNQWELEEFKENYTLIKNNISTTFLKIIDSFKNHNDLKIHIIWTQNKIEFILNNIYELATDINTYGQKIIKKEDLNDFNKQLLNPLNNSIKYLRKINDNMSLNLWLLEIATPKTKLSNDNFSCIKDMINDYEKNIKIEEDKKLDITSFFKNLENLNEEVFHSYQRITNIINSFKAKFKNKERIHVTKENKEYKIVIKKLKKECRTLEEKISLKIKEVDINDEFLNLLTNDPNPEIKKVYEGLIFYYEIINNIWSNNQVFEQILLNNELNEDNESYTKEKRQYIDDIEEITSLYFSLNLNSIENLAIFLNEDFLKEEFENEEIEIEKKWNCNEKNPIITNEKQHFDRISSIKEEVEEQIEKYKNRTTRHIKEENIQDVMDMIYESNKNLNLKTPQMINSNFSTESNWLPKSSSLLLKSTTQNNYSWANGLAIGTIIGLCSIVGYKIYNYFYPPNVSTDQITVSEQQHLTTSIDIEQSRPSRPDTSQFISIDEDLLTRAVNDIISYTDEGQSSISSSQSIYLNQKEQQSEYVDTNHPSTSKSEEAFI